MKKIFKVLVLCIISTSIYAQIPVIQPQESRFEFSNNYGRGTTLCYDKETGEYDLIVYSDNKYEEKTAIIPLGKTADEAMNSVVNLYNVMANEKAQFSLNGYDFYVASKDRIAILGVGKLEHTAGTYYITDSSICSMIRFLVLKKGVSIGTNCVVKVYDISYSSGWFHVILPTYGINKMWISLSAKGISDKFEKIFKAEKGYELSINDIAIIKKNIENGNIKDSDDAKFFLKVAETVIK